jgi:hypothetical protein
MGRRRRSRAARSAVRCPSPLSAERKPVDGLPEVFLALAEAAKQADKAVVLFVDFRRRPLAMPSVRKPLSPTVAAPQS